MGMGHLFRMIYLHAALQQMGVESVLVLIGEHAPSVEWLKKSGTPHTIVTDSAVADTDWEAQLVTRFGVKLWVNDQLQTDEMHASKIKDLGLALVTFDDLGSGSKLADLQVAALADTRGEVVAGKKVLTGVKYLILSPEISRYRRIRLSRGSLVASFGGSDTFGVTANLVEWLSKRRMTATLILGPGFDHEDELAGLDSDTFIVKKSVPSLAAEFSAHDLAVTGGGITAFEAAAAGLPTVTVANEPFEAGHCRYLQAIGCSVYAGQHDNVDWSILEQPFDIEKMSRAGIGAVDVDGARRVARELVSLSG